MGGVKSLHRNVYTVHFCLSAGNFFLIGSKYPLGHRADKNVYFGISTQPEDSLNPCLGGGWGGVSQNPSCLRRIFENLSCLRNWNLSCGDEGGKRLSLVLECIFWHLKQLGFITQCILCTKHLKKSPAAQCHRIIRNAALVIGKPLHHGKVKHQQRCYFVFCF